MQQVGQEVSALIIIKPSSALAMSHDERLLAFLVQRFPQFSFRLLDSGPFQHEFDYVVIPIMNAPGGKGDAIRLCRPLDYEIRIEIKDALADFHDHCKLQ